MKYLTKASAPRLVWARAAAGTWASVVGVAVGAVEVFVGAAVVRVEAFVVLEADALGLASPAHPASSIEAAIETATSPADIVFLVPDFTVSPTVKRTERVV